MAITQDDIIKYLEETKLKDLVDLVHKIEDHFGVSAAVAAAAAPAAAGADAAPSDYSVVITSLGGQKVAVIKAIKEITGLGLMEAKAMTEQPLPLTVKEHVKPDEAEALKAQLQEAGATVELK